MWQDKAACRWIGEDRADEVFFPKLDTERQKPPVKPLPCYEEARKWCASCEVRVECLEAAMLPERDVSWLNRYGMRGGLDQAERAKLAALRRANIIAGRPATEQRPEVISKCPRT